MRSGFSLAGRVDRIFQERVSPSFPPGTDEYWMEQALIESMNSVGISAPNPGVGCVIVKNGQEISRGFTREWRREHAEKTAFEALPSGVDLEGAEVFVTLEPCSHSGFQPACSDLFIGRGIARVVIAAGDPDPRVNGEGLRRLGAAGIRIVEGVLGPEVRAMLFPFMMTRGSQKSVWVAKWAQMPSGHLADVSGNSKWITNEKSRAYTHWLRQKYDAIVVGARTFLLDRPALTARDCAPPIQRQPERIVFDPEGKLQALPPEERSGFRILVCRDRMNPAFAEEEGVFSIDAECGSEELPQAFRAAVEGLGFHKPLQSVLVEGGPRLLGSLMGADLFDATHVFTGVQKFDVLSERERLAWDPGDGFRLQGDQVFGEDHLQEWLKEDYNGV